MARGLGSRVHFEVGDLERAPLSDESFDAVISNGAFCLVPHKPVAFQEMFRLLKPGGRFYFDEVTAAALATRGYRWLFDHPTEDRFTASEFVAELERQGLQVGSRWRTRVRGHYLLGVAQRPYSDAAPR